MILSYNLYGRVACMKIKAVLRSLFLAYALTGICLLLLAFLVFQMDIGTGDLLHGWWISGGKDHQEREIPLGRPGRSLLFHTFGNCFFYRERKLGYEPGTYDNNALYVPWRRYSWRHAILRKKCF